MSEGHCNNISTVSNPLLANAHLNKTVFISAQVLDRRSSKKVTKYNGWDSEPLEHDLQESLTFVTNACRVRYSLMDVEFIDGLNDCSCLTAASLY